MTRLTTQEHFRRILNLQQADRVPVWDFPWPGPLSRWYREGLPPGIGFAEFFDLDKIAWIEVDNSPRYEEQIIEETEQCRIYTTKWGATQKEFKHTDSTPEFVDYTVTTPEKWQEAKRRMTPSDDRIPWAYLTIKETGHCGPLFYPFVISMNLALLLTIIGLVLL